MPAPPRAPAAFMKPHSLKCKIDFRYTFAYAGDVERERKTRKFASAEEMGVRLQDISLEKMEEAFSRREYRRGGKLTELVEWRFQEMADFRLGPVLEKLTRAGICRETLGLDRKSVV